MRLIDADDLKESIKRQADILRTMGNEVLAEYTDIMQTGFCQEIDNAPTIEPEPHWIPCSERYPEQDERVFVAIGDYDYFVWDCMSNRGDDYFWEDEQGFYHNKYEVIAWRPMPEPYRGEQK